MQLAAVSDWPRVFEATAKSQFPAVSEDGSTLVELFADEEDFTGAPITTVVFWSKTGARLDSLRLGGAATASGPSAKEQEAVVRKINARLAKSKWRGLPVARECDPDASADRSTLRFGFGGGVTITWDNTTSKLVRTVGKRDTKLAGRFPSPGSRNSAEGGGGCGEVRGLIRGFGSAAIGLVVLVPHAQLGGDSCFGSPSADLAIAVRL